MGRSRAGHTLLELMLVVAIMVVLLALAVPMIGPMFAGSRVDAASDMVRARLAEMRVKAIEEGRPYALKVSKSRFRVEPAHGSGSGAILEGKLPGNVTFRLGNGARQESEDYQEIVRINANGAPESDAVISFADPEGGRAVDLRLRSVTGSVTAENRFNGRTP
jgi:prepilin-type N-terminal cleavage/methylation domain-containing protein